MASWVDILNSSRQGLSDSLNRRAQRKEGALNRLSTAGTNIANQLFSRKERVAGQGFLAGESEKERQGRLDVVKETGTQNMSVAEFNATKNQELQELVFKHQQALEGLSDENAREREKDRFENELKLITEQYQQGYEDFPEGATVQIDDPFTGQTYIANNPAEVTAALRAIESNAAVRTSKALQDLDNVANGKGLAIWEREFSKLQAAFPEIWAETEGWYVTVDQATYDRLRQTLNDNLMQLMRDGEIKEVGDLNAILGMLDTYVKIQGEEDSPDGGGANANQPWYLRPPQPLVAGSGAVTGGVQQVPLTNREPTQDVVNQYSSVPPYVGPNYAGATTSSPPEGYTVAPDGQIYPQGVSAPERMIYNTLMELFRTAEGQNDETTMSELNRYLERLLAENVNPASFLSEIRSR